MKKLLPLLVLSAFSLSAFAEDAAKKPATAAPAKPSTPGITITADKATLSKPLVLKDGAISQPMQTDTKDGGKAVFEFTAPKDGDYEIYAEVNATSEENNSFFLNIDAAPEEPLMIWDIDVTTGFEERVVSWRGNGDGQNDEFNPKRFTLKAGAHKINVVGREPDAALRKLTIRAVTK